MNRMELMLINGFFIVIFWKRRLMWKLFCLFFNICLDFFRLFMGLLIYGVFGDYLEFVGFIIGMRVI